MMMKHNIQTTTPVSAKLAEHSDSAFAERRLFPRTLPPPEVTEGSGGDSDWAMWDEITSQYAQIDINLDSPDFKNPV